MICAQLAKPAFLSGEECVDPTVAQPFERAPNALDLAEVNPNPKDHFGLPEGAKRQTDDEKEYGPYDANRRRSFGFHPKKFEGHRTIKRACKANEEQCSEPSDGDPDGSGSVLIVKLHQIDGRKRTTSLADDLDDGNHDRRRKDRVDDLHKDR